ncbi:MAG: ribonuclease E/G [Agathobacter sp.]|nr:ribonuclease E/G [Agathobacter sp.]
MNRLALTKYSYKNNIFTVCCGLNEKRELIDFQMFEPEENSLIDNIYIARVEKIVYNINAAFVKISNNQICYLALSDAKKPIYTQKKSKKNELCVGDEILVQVIKDAIKTKEPVVTTKLTLYGKYSILTTGNTSLSVSNKIGKELSLSLKEMLFLVCHDHEQSGYGILLRTNSKNVELEIVKEDVIKLIGKYTDLVNKSRHMSAMQLVCKSPQGYIKKLKATDLNAYDKVLTDDKKIYECICEELKDNDSIKKTELYNDDSVSLSTLYNLSGQIEKLLSNKVWLNSGANIIIEQLETLTVIDVNTSKNISGKENVDFSVNKEAAIEICKQIKLRNISGMIIIDFINMKSEKCKSELVSILKKEIKKDFVKCSFIDITGLGLVELTRKKTYKSLKEICKKY